MRRSAFLLLAVVGCASTPQGPFFGDERYLRFGVDPYQEAEAVIESQKSRGYPLALRIGGENFIALGFMDKGGRSSAVRILTMRGIAVALDDRAATPLEPGLRYALLAGPIQGTQDADRDGFEEVFVELRSQGEACLYVHRVRDVGMVDPVLTDTRVLGEAVCPRSAVDLDGDGVVELLTEVTLGGFDLRPAPRLLVPLWADQHRFLARAQTAPQRTWVAQQKKRREAELQQARARLDYGAAFLRAVELAAFAYLEGSDPKGQVAAFDRALGGMVLEPVEAAANLRARQRIFDTWNALQPADPAKPGAAVHASALLPPPEPEGDLLITPESAGPRRAAAPAGSVAKRAPTPVANANLPPEEIERHRAAARDAGNAAFAERGLATTARAAAQDERLKAQEARLRASRAPDSATAEEERRQAAEHVAAAQRYAAEAVEHSRKAAEYTTQRQEHRIAAYPELAQQPAAATGSDTAAE